MSWIWTKNIAGLRNGSAESITGYAAQCIALGRATFAGFNMFDSVWRDSHFDAVLEHDRKAYRIEIKKTQIKKTRKGGQYTFFKLTSGQRGGKQISRSAKQNTRRLSRFDCDAFIGVKAETGECWVIPVDVLEAFENYEKSIEAFQDFKEAWSLFLLPTKSISDGIQRKRDEVSLSEADSLWKKSIPELEAIAKGLGITIPNTTPFQSVLGRQTITFKGPYKGKKKWLVVEIWRHLARHLEVLSGGQLRYGTSQQWKRDAINNGVRRDIEQLPQQESSIADSETVLLEKNNEPTFQDLNNKNFLKA